MNVPLYELMRDAEKLFSQNKNVLKPTSLTARARVRLSLPLTPPPPSPTPADSMLPSQTNVDI